MFSSGVFGLEKHAARTFGKPFLRIWPPFGVLPCMLVAVRGESGRERKKRVQRLEVSTGRTHPPSPCVAYTIGRIVEI